MKNASEKLAPMGCGGNRLLVQKAGSSALFYFFLLFPYRSASGFPHIIQPGHRRVGTQVGEPVGLEVGLDVGL